MDRVDRLGRASPSFSGQQSVGIPIRNFAWQLINDLFLHCFVLLEFFFRGWNSIGISSNPQPNDGEPNGAFYSTISLDFKNQSRSSSDIGNYREVVGHRPNYHLLTEHFVTKILIDEETLAPTAVEVSQMLSFC
jgi:hypothetical protein